MNFADIVQFCSGAPTVLIAEPDATLRRAECQALSSGYKIVPTSCAAEAVRFAASHRTKLDLLLTEVRLPRMDGWELAELLKLDYPDLKVVYLSPSIDPAISAHTRPDSIFLLREKQLDADLLRRTIRDVIENDKHGTSCCGRMRGSYQMGIKG